MPTAEQLAKLHEVVPFAQDSARRWKVPASVTLAQWIFESSWGASRLSLTANNVFGIKHSHLRAMESYVEFPTWEYEGGQKVLVSALFVKFATVAGCFDAHGRMLAIAARYRPAMQAAGIPKVFAVDLQRCGYSTNARYAVDLVSAMRELDLFRYDVAPVVAPQPPAQPPIQAATQPDTPAVPASPHSQVH